MSDKIYEVWFDSFDGTQANIFGRQKRVHTYLDKQKALDKIDELNEGNSEEPYYLKEVDLDD